MANEFAGFGDRYEKIDCFMLELNNTVDRMFGYA